MPGSYTTANKTSLEILDALLKESYYSELSAVGVTFDILFAFATKNEQGEKTGPALKDRGYPCNGVVSITPLKYRVRGMSDAEIILDGDNWTKLSPEQQRALIDHEVRHIVVSRSMNGDVITDSFGRPKLKLALHHIQTGWFVDVAKRNGAASAEVEQATQIFAQYKQELFGFVGSVKGSKKKALADKPEEA